MPVPPTAYPLTRYVALPATERQERLCALAWPLAQRFAERAASHDEAASFAHENIADLHAAGLLGLAVPEEHGGLGANELEAPQVVELIAWGDASTGLAYGMHVSLTGQLASARELWPAHAPRLLAEATREGAMLNAAQAEPEMGSPAHGGVPMTTATRQSDGGWRLTGRKTFTTGAPALRYFLVMAAISEAGQPPRVGNFLVPADAPGVRVEHTWHGLALRASGSDDLVLDDVPLPATAQLDERAPGTPDPRSALGLPWGALVVSSVYTGLALAARDECVHFAATRVPSGLGKPIATIPSVQRHLGEIEALLLASHRLLYGFARDWVEHPQAHASLRGQGALIKSLTTNHAVTVTDLALRVIGGAGLRPDMRISQLLRDARAGLINAPLDDVALQSVGKAAAEGAARSVSQPRS